MIQKTYISTIAREMLFQAWVSPEMAIAPITQIECDPVVGGVFKLIAQSPESTDVMEGEFLEIIWNRKLRYTWAWEGTAETCIVEVRFKQEGAQSVVELEHSGFLSDASEERHDEGWDLYFQGLESKLKERLAKGK